MIAFLAWFVGFASGTDASESVAAKPVPTETVTVTATATPTTTAGSAAPVSQAPTAAAGGGSAKGAIATTVVPVIGVVDGDTIRVSIDGTTERLRIIGLDAPELSDNECYAQAAASKLQSLVQSKDVHIAADPTQSDRDSHDRVLRHVWTLDGTNVAQELIHVGLAKEYTYDKAYFGQPAYQAAQKSATGDKLGIWSGTCDISQPGGSDQPATQAMPLVPQQTSTPAPKKTTAAPKPKATKTATPKPATPKTTPAKPAAPKTTAPKPAAPKTTAPSTSGCKIKGNISNKGEKIYHVPGQRYYNATKIDKSKGERWFCSESDAVAAGWRKAKV